MKFSSGLTKFSPYVRAERTETTCPLSKYVRDGVVKQCFQPLSPSDRELADETEKAECRLQDNNSIKVIHLSFNCCTSPPQTLYIINLTVVLKPSN
jgi:hypothetical protein